MVSGIKILSGFWLVKYNGQYEIVVKGYADGTAGILNTEVDYRNNEIIIGENPVYCNSMDSYSCNKKQYKYIKSIKDKKTITQFLNYCDDQNYKVDRSFLNEKVK